MAGGRGGADEVLVAHVARRYQLRGTGRPQQTPLADRTRLPGPQAGSWARPLRRTWLARVTSPHNPLYRCIRTNGRFSPPQEPRIQQDPRRLSFPPVTDPAAPPLRPVRHIPNSIATLRQRLIVELVEHLPRCPCCGTRNVMKVQLNI